MYEVQFLDLEIQVECLEWDIQSLKHELTGDRTITLVINYNLKYPLDPPEMDFLDGIQIYSTNSSYWEPLIMDSSLPLKSNMVEIDWEFRVHIGW